MLKKYTFWLKAAFIAQIATAVIHSISFFVKPEPIDETEKILLNLMNTYKPDAGAGFAPSTHDLFMAMSAGFALLLLISGLINWHLWRKKTDLNIMKGIIDINLIIFGVCFIIMLHYTFLPPIVCIGLILLFLFLARLAFPSSK